MTLQSLLVSSRDAYVILGHPKVGRASRKPTRPFSKAPQSKMGWALAGPAARIGPHSHRAPKRDFALSHLHHSFSTHQFNVERFSFTCVCVCRCYLSVRARVIALRPCVPFAQPVFATLVDSSRLENAKSAPIPFHEKQPLHSSNSTAEVDLPCNRSGGLRPPARCHCTSSDHNSALPSCQFHTHGD